MTQQSAVEDPPRSQRSQAFALAAEPHFKIIYLFPHPMQNLAEASRFGWYTPGILATARPMQQACELPADIREAHSDLEDVLVHRLIGAIWPCLQPVEIASLKAVLEIMPSPFVVCVTTDAEVAALTDQILHERELPVLHVSAIPGPGRKSREGFNLAGICEFVRKVIDALAAYPGNARFVRESRRLLSEVPQRKLRKHPLRAGMHNVTAPNELALAAFGYKFPVARAISERYEEQGKRSADKYVERICQSADAVTTERARLLKDREIPLEDNRAIVAVASSHAELYRSWKDLLQRAPEEGRRDLRHALSFVVRSTTYYFDIPANDKGQPTLAPIARLVSKQLELDMRAFTAALGMLSSATLCPVLRLEPKLNSVRADAAELARCVRAAGMHRAWKESRMVRLMGQKMRASIHAEFLKRIDAKETGSIEGLKLITDLPLELMPSNGIPLGLRFNVSRVSPVPGNMFWQICNLPPVRIPKEAFYDVLIIRSFESSDPIRTALQDAVASVEGTAGFSRLKYRFVDVSTSDQFVAAVNEHKGAVMVFDGHGKYDAGLGIGRLVVGGTTLDAWALKRECELPPVVMFSACDTQPIDGSHGSVATSAFALGARAVLGTMLPVNAGHAAILMARMFLRIDMFLPVAAKHLPVMTWRHVVSGMLRMSHTVEASRTLNARAQLGMSRDALSRIQMASNVAINSWDPSWYDAWIEEIAKESGRADGEIRILLEKHVGLTDAMKYVQLGNPERVMIY